MFTPRRPARARLHLQPLETRDVPAGGLQTFDQTGLGALPAGWMQWASDNTPIFAVTDTRSLSAPQGLVSSSSLSSRSALAWNDESLLPDSQVSASISLDSLIPAGVFLRGSNLTTSAPSFYSATVYRGTTLELSRTVAGVRTTLATVTSTTYTSGPWVQVSMNATADVVQVSVFRTDTRQYLDSAGRWVATPSNAINVQDSGLRSTGRAGLIRRGAYAGAVTFDDLNVVGKAAPDATPPTVKISTPAATAVVTGTIRVVADTHDNVGVSRVEFLFDGQRKSVVTRGAFSWEFNTRSVPDGPYALEVRAFDAMGNVGSARQTITVRNGPVPVSQPQIPQHLPNIRVAMLAWNGTPFTDFEKGLLQNAVDLVMPNERYLGLIDSVSPNTPQLVYTNLSNVYLNLLTDWLGYADNHGLSRENAFYHVAQATQFFGGSPSSIPVNVLWDVRIDTANLTTAARDPNPGDVPFGGQDQSLHLGYVDPFRELNFGLTSGASAGWSGVVEYPSAVDAAGNPTAWQTLTLLSDSTNGFGTSGTLVFDPPPDWKTASLDGGAKLYYVRVRTATAGTPPVASTILGRDYVNAIYASNGVASGVTPAFDSTADLNHDGYLTDAEYANRAAGKDARFVHESRLTYMNYGQMRFATNPTGAGFSAWAVDFDTRMLQTNALADGLFMDNSNGKSPTIGVVTVEPSATYTADYGALLNTVKTALAPKWLLANTAGMYAESDAVINQVPAHWQEFAVRPLANSWTQFEDLAAIIRHRQGLTSPSPYTVIDVLPNGGSPTDPRTQIAALAYYYLLANPQSTFFMFNGGNEPATSWTRHWFDAIAYDVGKPQGDWSVFASGADPSNAALGYKIYQRSYRNALVLHKPLSYTRLVSTGTVADNTATTHQLNGTYRPLQADGTLGAPVTSVTLRNGEGAILVRTKNGQSVLD